MTSSHAIGGEAAVAAASAGFGGPLTITPIEPPRADAERGGDHRCRA